MGFKCSAIGCKTGYAGTRTPTGVTMHRMPLENEEQLQKWLHAMKRKDFQPTENTRLCSLHFADADFESFRQDKNTTRKRHHDEILERRRLKLHAVPRYFRTMPEYYQRRSPQKRQPSSRARPSVRRAVVNAALDKRNKDTEQAFDRADGVSSLEQIQEKLSSVAVQGFAATRVQSQLVLSLIDLNPTTHRPVIISSISILDNIEVFVTVQEGELAAQKYSHIVISRIDRFSQVENLMAFVKSESAAPSDVDWLDIGISCLQKYVKQSRDQDARKVEFNLEQLKLSKVATKSARRYSSAMLLFAYSVHAASPQAYEQLRAEEVITCPSVRTLRRITRRVGNPQEGSSEYLQLRLRKLPETQRNVSLLLDEIYVAKRAEYCGGSGRMIGITADEAPASTVLSFMITSAAGNYRDVVALYPISKLDADQLFGALLEVLRMLADVGFNVLAVIADNFSVNRRCFSKYLCSGGGLQPCVPNPVNGQPLHIVIDSTHNIKNVYNNFQRRRRFHFPDGSLADFRHLEELHSLQRNSSLAMAHKLTEEVLHPSSIAKTSTRLASAIFCDSTVAALQWNVEHEGRNEWKGTADFLLYVMQYWNVVNVRSPKTGSRLIDNTRRPIESLDDVKFKFLHDFAIYLERWAKYAGTNPGSGGLTKATNTALQQTTRALISLARYCLEELGFHYVLLGKFSSDAIESRFGWYRQMNGGNYYLSCRQLFQNEQKIRAISLIRFSGCTLDELPECVQPKAVPTDVIDSMTETAEQLLLNASTPSAADANIINYVVGALVRRTLRRFKDCGSCGRALLSQIDGTPEAMPLMTADGEEISADVNSFIQMINRGGLLMPSSLAFAVGIKAWTLFNVMKEDDNLRRKFLGSPNQKSLFLSMANNLLHNDCDLDDLAMAQDCDSGHDFVTDLVGRLFGAFAKSFVRSLSEYSLSSMSANRKITKLSSSKV